MPHVSKSDEFLEKFQTAFDPPPHFRKVILWISRQNCDKSAYLVQTKKFLPEAFIVAKKWDPGILDPSRFSGQIRKVEARLGKLAKIRKVEID